MSARQAIRVQKPDSSISSSNAVGNRLGQRDAEGYLDLATPLSESAERLYSDSRRLEITCDHFIRDYRHLKIRSNSPDVGIDGFTTVSSGYKPSVASTKLYMREYSDFYRFQVKEKRLQEWRTSSTQVGDAKRVVADMGKRKRFEL